jgi:hypothetical protein
METVHSKFLNISSIFCFPGGPRVLTNMSSGDIKAKQGDLVNLLCSAPGEPPIIFSWEKDHKPLESFFEKYKPHRSSFLVVTVKDQTSFGKYICHIRDRFKNTTHTIWVQKLQCKGNHAFSILFKKYMDVLVPTLVKINKYKPRTKQVMTYRLNKLYIS